MKEIRLTICLKEIVGNPGIDEVREHKIEFLQPHKLAKIMSDDKGLLGDILNKYCGSWERQGGQVERL